MGMPPDWKIAYIADVYSRTFEEVKAGYMESERKKGISLKRLIAKCDKLWTAVVLKLGNYTCAICGGEANTAHHVFHKKANNRARYDLRNGLPICPRCHLRERWNPTPVAMAAREYHGNALDDLYRDIRELGGGKTWKRGELEGIAIALEEMLKGSA